MITSADQRGLRTGLLLLASACALAAAPAAPDDSGWDSRVPPPFPLIEAESKTEGEDTDDAGPTVLGAGWTVDVGGQFRYRLMHENNKSLTGASPRRNDFHLWRTRIHGDFRNDNGMRVFVEAVDARINGEERSPLPIDRNDFDLLNAYVEYDAGVPAFRLGRMELQEGAQRLVSPLEWGNTRRTFEGGMVRLDHADGGRTDLFVAHPVMVDVHDSDKRDKGRWFSGLYHSGKSEEGQSNWDLFALALNEVDDVLVADDGSPGDMDLYTVGGRWADRCGPFDYEFWGARQFGHRAGDMIRAHAWSARFGWTFADIAGAPRLGLDVDSASGDSRPGDGKVETFNQLYPLGHAYFGFLDMVGRQNIFAVSPNLTVKLDERTTFRTAWHSFRLAEAADALYNAGGAALFVDPTGAAGRELGNELDLTLKHKPTWWDGRSTILLGWSKFFAGERMDDLGGRGDARLFYLQVLLDF